MTLTTFAVHLDPDETDTFLHLMQALGVSTPDGLLRVALYNQARVSGLDIHHDACAIPRKRRSQERTPCDGK